MQKKYYLRLWYLLIGFIILFFIYAFYAAFKTTVLEGEKWRSMGDNNSLQYRTVMPFRGNVYSSDNKIIAITLPNFEVRFDAVSEAITDVIFKKNVDSLAYGLSTLFKDKTKLEYKKILLKGRKEGKRSLLIKKEIDYYQMLKLKKFPIFRLGKYKGGLVLTRKYKREKPFGDLAFRTIGEVSLDPDRFIGIEAAYNKQLAGDTGRILSQKLTGNVWKPISTDNEKPVVDGADVITTIDSKVQDMAESELMYQLEHIDQANHGCVIVMEVATGAVKAIANLGRQKNGKFAEIYNYAIGDAVEPGSVFKLPSLMAAMELGGVTLNTPVNTSSGSISLYGQTFSDAHGGNFANVKSVFAHSSNVGTIKIINNVFGKNPQSYLEQLNKFGFGKPIGIELSGEGKPRIKSTKDKDWAPVDMSAISIGYSSLVTPLQMLTFYNAVANNGKMMKPMFVTIIKRGLDTLQKFNPIILNKQIASSNTIKMAQEMMEAVVIEGTARKPLEGTIYKVAGKTGTARIAKNGSYENGSHTASFVGYFPADKPKYSCIVVINTDGNQYYGGEIACPIFRRVGDLLYASTDDMFPPLLVNPDLSQEKIPANNWGNTEDYKKIYKFIKVPFKGGVSNYSKPALAGNNSVKLENFSVNIKRNIMPNLIGLGLRDAVFILDKMEVKTIAKGYGKVVVQTPEAGVPISNKVKVILDLK